MLMLSPESNYSNLIFLKVAGSLSIFMTFSVYSINISNAMAAQSKNSKVFYNFDQNI
jgi:hypothetical protein